MKHSVVDLFRASLGLAAAVAWEAPLGLPEVSVPADNPQSPEKIALGDKLFHDQRFSSTGEVMS